MNLDKLKPTKKKVSLSIEDFSPSSKEFVPSKIGATSPKVRQAGADLPDGKWIKDFRPKAERYLYVFAKSVLGALLLIKSFQLPICAFLTSAGKRKMVLVPRETGKTMIVSRALPLHILIQPRSDNLYFQGQHGFDQRIIIASKAARMAKDSLMWVRTQTEVNPLLHALWPERFWPGRREARAKSRAWSNDELVFPMPDGHGGWSDPHIRAVGVGAAITGAHPTVLIKDDLINEEDHASPIVMATAIQWHDVSRALINSPGAREFIVGTRWHIHDLYQHIMKNQPSVKFIVRALEEDGEIIYPEFTVTYPDGSVRAHGFSEDKIKELKMELGSMMYALQYNNDARDPSLVDFDESQLRSYTYIDGQISYDAEQRDIEWADIRKKGNKSVNFRTPAATRKDERQEQRLRALRGRPSQLERRQ